MKWQKLIKIEKKKNLPGLTYTDLLHSTCLFQNRICLRFSSQEHFNGSVELFICVLQFNHHFNTEYDRSTEAVDTGISEATSIASPSATLGQKYSESCWWLTDLSG